MRRQFFRLSFGLKFLLVIVTVCAMISYLLRDRYRAARRLDTIAQLSRNGAFVLFGCQSPPGTAPQAADQEVVYVSLGLNVYDFSDVMRPRGFPIDEQRLARRMLLGRRRGTSAGDLTTLPRLKSVRVLDVGTRRLTDDDLAYIGGLPLLRVLIARDARGVTDEGLRHLSPLTNLRLLELPYTAITDNGLKALERHENIESLNLHGAPITGIGLEHLHELSRLRQLDVGRTLLGDATIAKLQEFKSLEFLSLRHTGITDESLMVVQRLRKLSRLDISRTEVTFDALERLRVKYPKGIVITQ